MTNDAKRIAADVQYVRDLAAALKKHSRRAANDDSAPERFIREGRKADRLIFFVLAIPVWVYLLILIVRKVAE